MCRKVAYSSTAFVYYGRQGVAAKGVPRHYHLAMVGADVAELGARGCNGVAVVLKRGNCLDANTSTDLCRVVASFFNMIVQPGLFGRRSIVASFADSTQCQRVALSDRNARVGTYDQNSVTASVGIDAFAQGVQGGPESLSIGSESFFHLNLHGAAVGELQRHVVAWPSGLEGDGTGRCCGEVVSPMDWLAAKRVDPSDRAEVGVKVEACGGGGSA